MKAVGDRLGRDDGADWVSVAHRLGDSDNVRNHPLRLKCPVVGADAAEADLNFVGDCNSASLADRSAS